MAISGTTEHVVLLSTYLKSLSEDLALHICFLFCRCIQIQHVILKLKSGIFLLFKRTFLTLHCPQTIFYTASVFVHIKNFSGSIYFLHILGVAQIFIVDCVLNLLLCLMFIVYIAGGNCNTEIYYKSRKGSFKIHEQVFCVLSDGTVPVTITFCSKTLSSSVISRPQCALFRG